MPNRRKGRGTPGIPRIPHVYEGPELLTSLLHAAGSPFDAHEAGARFAAALSQGIDRAEVIQGLFPEEPRFASPDDARRIYSNLFGLWDRMAAGLGAEDETPEPTPTPLPTPVPMPVLPPRGTAHGDRLTPRLVEAVWKHVAAIPDRDRRRLRDRFENVQPDLVAFLDALTLPESSAVAAADLAFEAWVMFDQAFGDRLGSVEWSELKALEAEPPPLETEQPPLAAYVAEQLDNLADEDPQFREEERAQVERALATVVAALGGKVEGRVEDPKPS